MNAAQMHLSFAVGSVVSLLALALALLCGASFQGAVFRAAVVMCLTSVICAAFLRYFTGIVHAYVAARIQAEREAAEAAGKSETAESS